MEQSIRVSARGEFGQLQRGLNQLQGDLKNVVGEIDKGARKGGFFDDSQIRALDVFSRRFKDTLRELDREFKKQNDTIDEMGRKMERAQGAERDAIKKTITERERELDLIRKQIIETERLYDMQGKGLRGTPPAGTPSGGASAGGGRGSAFPPNGSAPSLGSLGGRQQPAQFSSLSRGLQQLRKDLSGYSGAVDKGARSGGIFDDKQVKALDFFRRRFESTFDAMGQELEKQSAAWEDLYNVMRKASGEDKTALQKELADREKVLEKMSDEIDQLERIYQLRKREAAGFGKSSSDDDDDSDGGGSIGGVGGASSKLLGLGKFTLGLAGLTGIASMAQEAYGLAYNRQVNTLDLAQRMRGQAGRTGSNVEQYDAAGAVGRSDNMGYKDTETWSFLDQYTRGAGNIDTEQQQALLKFGRSYGLNTSEVASGVSSNMAIGGATKPKEFADAIAGSVAKSGMTPRILEVMTTNNTLLQQMNTTLKDGSAKQILAYQTTLDKIGMDNGMTQLTGAQGANLIGGMGGIYTPGNDQWKWMGIRALQQYDPKKYGGMDLYDLESSFEDGLMNEDNIPAMAQYVKGISGGNDKLQKRIMQKWLTDGGFAATKSEAGEFYDATNGLTSFNEDQMKQIENGSIDSGAKYDEERSTAQGQDYMDTDARFEAALSQIGRPILEGVMAIKEPIVSAASALGDVAAGNTSIGEVLNSIMSVVSDGFTRLLAGGDGSTSGGIGGAVDNFVGNATNMLNGTSKEPTFKTPQQRTQYYKELEQEKRDQANALESEVTGKGGILEKSKSGKYLSTEESKKLAEWANMQARDRAAMEHLQSPAVDRVASATGAALQNGAQGVMQGAAAASDALLGMPSSKDAAATKAYIEAQLSAQGKELLARQASGQTLSKDEQATLAASPSGDNLLLRSQRGEKLSKEEQASLSRWVDTSYQERKASGDVKTPWIDRAAEAIGGAATGGAGAVSSFFQQLFGTGTADANSKDGGDSSIGIMPGMQRDLKTFTEDGTTSLNTMGTNTKSLYEDSIELAKKDTKTTNQAMEEFNTETDRAMASFNTEFRGFKTYVGSLFAPMLTFFSNLGDQISTTFGSGSGYNASTNSGVTASALNAKLGGKLSGMGEAFVQAGQANGVDPALLASIAMQETGNGTSDGLRLKNNVGGMMGKYGLMNFGSVEEGIQKMAANLQKNYISQGLTSVSDIQQKYAPIGATNDPRNLNSNWTTGVNSFLNGFGVNTSSGSSGAGFFKGWQSRVTTNFGDVDGSHSTPHRGLDIDGEQGDNLQALAGGTVSFIKRDPDNKTDGGNTVGIKMKDGKTYFYAHMSKISDALKEGASVNAGDYVGNLGGDPGTPGAGSHTTGSHLHLGYMDSQQNLLDPQQLLNGMNAGDSSIGNMVSSATAQKSEITVTLKLDGEGAAAVNKATSNNLEYLVRKIIKESERQKLQLSPSKGGY
jgi:hypothetical protein